MIEAIKDYLYLEDDKEEFSVIQVYPYLTSGLTEEELESDRTELINFGHSLEIAESFIHVRSKEAMKDIEDTLRKYGFERLKETGRKCYGLANYRGSKEMVGTQRKYYKPSDSEKVLLSETLTVLVKYPISELSRFKEVIMRLSEKDYRNMWSLNKERTKFLIK